jgi:hypothetical protein
MTTESYTTSPDHLRRYMEDGSHHFSTKFERTVGRSRHER